MSRTASQRKWILSIPIPLESKNLIIYLSSSPDPYLRGAELCGVDPKRCLVVEDAPAGIAAGHAAGAKTLAVITSHTREGMLKENPTYLVKNLGR